ncbi:APC family permease [Thermoactinomyces mirandus]|uniref:APC family permease n=1 Tax=Thermoactinomyces mirandus TaxID=2756294 RepID=A0A7W1XS99_9BACL|nr:APC family permease [Thermoactinomyces mirandus]MBA4602251.1 APC family permease [Thermoactinomyces mirandus]
MKEKQRTEKVLSRIDVLALAFGAMIGWGWVVLTGEWIRQAGLLGSVLAFVGGGIMVLFVGLVYSELTAAMPQTGGVSVFLDRALGYRWSFIASWAIALGYISVVAFEAVALPTVIDYIFPDYQSGFLWQVAGWDVYLSWAGIGMAGSVFVTWINYRGLKQAAVFQVICTTMLTIIGLVLIIGSPFTASPEGISAPFAGMTGLFGVLIMTPFMFVGFDVIPQTAAEINLPFKQIGKVLILSVSMAVVWYVGIVYAVGHSMSMEDINRSVLPTADALATLLGSPWGGTLLIIGGIGGILTSWNAFFVGGSRILYVMAQKRMLPAFFGRFHPKYNTPVNAILLIGAISFIAPLFGRQALLWLTNAGSFSIVMTYILVSVSFVVLRKKEPGMIRPFRAGKSSWIGYGALLSSLCLGILYLPGMPSSLRWPYEWIMLLLWWLAGLYYFVRLCGSKKSLGNRRIGAEPHDYT